MSKKAAFGLLVAVLAMLFLEGFSFLCCSFLQRGFSLAGFYAQARDPVPSADVQVVQPEVVHPYLGYVYNYDNKNIQTRGGSRPVSRFGFMDDQDPIRRRSKGTVVVGITGGSFAQLFALEGDRALAERLGKAPRFAGKTFRFVRLAVSGYKQPQQLLALAYLFSLGAEFDILINLDGFNEVALPSAENVPSGFNPFFPRDWLLRVQGLRDPGLLIQLGKIARLERFQARLARRMSASLLRYSFTCHFLWKVLDHLAMRRLYRTHEELAALEAKLPASYAAAGPPFDYSAGPARLYGELAAMWARSSLAMARLCRAYGTLYVHFLQPNQYVEGSKPFTEEERAIACSADQPFKRGVEAGYPLLIREGKALAAQGVAFHDLTRVFAASKEPAYVDNCCHVSKEANERLGRRIGEYVLRDLAESSAGLTSSASLVGSSGRPASRR